MGSDTIKLLAGMVMAFIVVLGGGFMIYQNVNTPDVGNNPIILATVALITWCVQYVLGGDQATRVARATESAVRTGQEIPEESSTTEGRRAIARDALEMVRARRKSSRTASQAARDEAPTPIDDLCSRCGIVEDSPIHDTDSENEEIRQAAHEFLPRAR